MTYRIKKLDELCKKAKLAQSGYGPDHTGLDPHHICGKSTHELRFDLDNISLVTRTFHTTLHNNPRFARTHFIEKLGVDTYNRLEGLKNTAGDYFDFRAKEDEFREILDNR